MTKVISLELNEINFEFIKAYIERGELPNCRRLLQKHGLIETVSEKGYPDLEPWIQWPTVYTGLSYRKHGIFRLGDVLETNHAQIWEYLEKRGKKVGAISPINAANRCENAAFFLPDPWTDTPMTAEPGVARLYNCIKRIVNDNASDNRSLYAVARELLLMAMPFIAFGSITKYLELVIHARKHRWMRAAILDRLLADVFFKLWHTHQPDYASLFLNAGAHIQHHHMYDSPLYKGERSNPKWYSSAADGSIDPLLMIYRTYDSVLSDFMALKGVRLFVTTGLSQYPNEKEHYQYRLVRHAETLSRFGLSDYQVLPRMSRDFLLTFADRAAAERAAALLARVECRGKPFFTIDSRSESLFCQVGYYGAPEGLKEVVVGGQELDLTSEIVLVSIENGLHQTQGYHVDTRLDAVEANALPQQPLTSLFDKFARAVLERPAGKSDIGKRLKKQGLTHS
jgi:hypothetical protein